MMVGSPRQAMVARKRARGALDDQSRIIEHLGERWNGTEGRYVTD